MTTTVETTATIRVDQADQTNGFLGVLIPSLMRYHGPLPTASNNAENVRNERPQTKKQTGVSDEGKKDTSQVHRSSCLGEAEKRSAREEIAEGIGIPEYATRRTR